MKTIFCLAFATMTLIGCGSPEKYDQAKWVEYKDEQSLPQCDEGRKDEIVSYREPQKTYVVCNGEIWN
jgi:hypothetical protein